MGKTRLKVGIFVTVSFFILAAAILWLAGSRFFQPVDNYQIVFEQSVSGLLPGAAVEYLGVTVGKVEGVRLTDETPPRAAVTIALEPGTPIRKDTSATLDRLTRHRHPLCRTHWRFRRCAAPRIRRNHSCQYWGV